jgi:GGDEF domain-containing protein
MAVVLPQTDVEGAEFLAERVREAIRRSRCRGSVAAGRSG